MNNEYAKIVQGKRKTKLALVALNLNLTYAKIA